MLALLLVTVTLGSCQTDDYLLDGGKSNPYYDGTIMDYLESQDDMLFSDLVKVIKMTKWYDIFSDENADVTFFVPTDFSLNRSVDMLNYYLYNWNNMDKITDLSQVKRQVWEDMIEMYVVKGKYRLNDIAQIDTVALSTFPGQTNYTYDKKYKLTMGVCYGDANGIKYAGYRQIMCANQDYGFPYMATYHPAILNRAMVSYMCFVWITLLVLVLMLYIQKRWRQALIIRTILGRAERH